MQAEQVNIAMAFLAGVISFVSPCVLPIIPSYISIMSGSVLTNSNLISAKVRLRTFLNSVFFVFGFSLVFIVLGVTASAIGFALRSFLQIMQWVGGAIVIIFGFYYLGLFRIRLLDNSRTFNYRVGRNVGFTSAFVLGVVFGFSWIPCVGVVLSAILILASTSETILLGLLYLCIYSLGLAIPFLVLSLLLGSLNKVVSRINNAARIIRIISGIFLIMMGIFIISGSMIRLVGWISHFVNLGGF
ncbi:MAG: cytochrome c biogenesis protein CcdA [Actinobacteria bacterium]|nr:cytochrome c biogenesis protein CcdA [Actinomycetota bacterium]